MRVLKKLRGTSSPPDEKQDESPDMGLALECGFESVESSEAYDSPKEVDARAEKRKMQKQQKQVLKDALVSAGVAEDCRDDWVFISHAPQRVPCS